jgi:hypothetical protein
MGAHSRGFFEKSAISQRENVSEEVFGMVSECRKLKYNSRQWFFEEALEDKKHNETFSSSTPTFMP